ncbi:MAG: asparagine synthase (glutamine-hydrolyzing) [Lachnospiraceae bacterium]|nr:asparagine synthase (glutamine-hydrolyzing) [Lachnospiraceae bacterium]
MCGICGFLTKDTVRLEQLQEMNNTMYHRGPDDAGAEIFSLSEGYLLGLAQRRLSILDLSELGHQPMHSKDGAVSIVFNGEIYNFLELKEELKDYPFTSHCDTEVILAAYLKWGIQCIDRLNGMFAIALFDRKTDELFLVRDRVGKKPLYYSLESDGIVFASELKPIMAYPGFHKKINQQVLVRYLYQQYIASPDSIYENVNKLAPGSILRFCKGDVKQWKYWDVAEVYQSKRKSSNAGLGYEDAKAELKDLLIKATKQRMIADVPLGAFLSGGYDSSLITGIAQSISGDPVKTYSIGFNDEKYNEAVYAKAVADHLGTKHTEVYIDENDMFRLVESIPKYYDEPFADSSQIPSMLVSEVAKKDVTVALSGDGGDELFCGYNVYEKVASAQKLDKLGAFVHGVSSVPGIRSLKLESKLPYAVRTIAANRDKLTKTQFGGENYIGVAQSLLLHQEDMLPGKFPMEDRYHEKNWQEIRMLVDIETYLPDDILCKVDRASMMYSLEARCPILDKNVIEFAFALEHKYKFDKGIKKRILKELAYEYVPKELLERPKVGFAVPLDKWLHGPLKDQLLDMSSKDFLVRQGIFDPLVTRKFIEAYLQSEDGKAGYKYSKVVWPFFVFQQWYQHYFK